MNITKVLVIFKTHLDIGFTGSRTELAVIISMLTQIGIYFVLDQYCTPFSANYTLFTGV